jgi:hypothetical protein
LAAFRRFAFGNVRQVSELNGQKLGVIVSLRSASTRSTAVQCTVEQIEELLNLISQYLAVRTPGLIYVIPVATFEGFHSFLGRSSRLIPMNQRRECSDRQDAEQY